MELKNGDPARGFLQKLLESADKATKGTQSLLAFSRIQPVSKETKPDIKVLFLSGYSDDIITNKTIHNEGLPFSIFR